MSFWDNKKVLVTGGAGFIGSHLVEDLVRERAIITVADNLERGSIENLRRVSKEIIMYITDLRNYDNCVKICRSQNIVMNLAAEEANSRYVYANKRRIFENNMLIQMNVLKAACESKVDKFLFVSSSCIYSCDVNVPTMESESENAFPSKSISVLGWVKRMGEELSQHYAEESHMSVSIARLYSTFGARDNFDLNTCHLIAAIIKQVVDNYNPITVWGSSEQRRAFVYVKDAVKCLKFIVERSTSPEPVNVGHDCAIAISDLVNKIQNIVGVHNQVNYKRSNRYGCAIRAADVSKLSRITNGFIPTSEIDTKLMEVINYYKYIKRSIEQGDVDLASYYEGE